MRQLTVPVTVGDWGMEIGSVSFWGSASFWHASKCFC